MNFPSMDITQRPDLAPSVGQAVFAALLAQHTSQQPASKTEARKKAEKAAGDLVANALILPVMKQLRRSPYGENTVFSGGMGEKAFGPEFDIQIADRLAHSPRMAVTQVLANRLEKKAPAQKKLDVHG
jgi:hypothetical protein